MYKTSESDGFVEFSLKQIHIKTMKILFNKTQYILNAQVFFQKWNTTQQNKFLNQSKKRKDWVYKIHHDVKSRDLNKEKER